MPNYNSWMIRLTVTPSPSPDAPLRRYAEDLFPKFHLLFQAEGSGARLPISARRAREPELALVLENRSEKDITAVRYRFVFTFQHGRTQTKRISSDSYLVDVYRAVLQAGDRQLITPDVNLNESSLEQLLREGTGIGSGRGADMSPQEEIAAAAFQIDLLVFQDGEIAGADPDQYAAELRCRKPAAEFVARQVRLAEAEGRDCAPVLAALADAPHLREDYLGRWTRRYARQYLEAYRNTGQVDLRESTLRHLENRPLLPKFYRRDGGPVEGGAAGFRTS